MEWELAEISELARMGALVNHAANDGEEQTGNHAMRKHLEHGSGDGRRIGGGETEEHEAHVAHARVADDEFKIVLHEGDEASVENADDGEGGDGRLPKGETDGEERHGDTEATVGAEFHDDTGEEHRGGGGRGDVTGGRPRMERKHTGEDGEAGEDEGEETDLFAAGEVRGGGGEVVQGEAGNGSVGDGDGVGPKETGEDEGAAGERIENELHRGVLTRDGRAPVGDQEIFRDNRDLVEDEHRKRVSTKKHAEDAADESEVEREKFADAVVDVPREKDAHGGGETGEHEECEADTIGREMVANAEFGNPREVDDRLESGRRSKRRRGEQRQRKGRERSDQRDPTSGSV